MYLVTNPDDAVLAFSLVMSIPVVALIASSIDVMKWKFRAFCCFVLQAGCMIIPIRLITPYGWSASWHTFATFRDTHPLAYLCSAMLVLAMISPLITALLVRSIIKQRRRLIEQPWLAYA